MNFDEFQQIIIGFDHLKALHIEIHVDFDWCDGFRWESLISQHLQSLHVFNFKFLIRQHVILPMNGIQTVLGSFSTRFWLIEKRWFIAIEWEQRLIYSIEKYSAESADPNFQPPRHHTALDQTIFFDRIQALALWSSTISRFNHVEELWLIDDPTTIDFHSVVNLERIRNLVVVLSKIELTIDQLFSLTQSMKRLDTLHLIHISSLFEQPLSTKFQFNRIRSLIVTQKCSKFRHWSLFKQIFPYLERFKVQIRSFIEIEDILYQLTTPLLSIFEFDCDPSKITFNRHWFEQVIGHSNFTVFIGKNSIRLWIGSKNRQYTNGTQQSRTYRLFSSCFPVCSRSKR